MKQRKPSAAAQRRAAEEEQKKNATYDAARAKAQSLANELGFDHGLEWNPVFREWHIFMLPQRQNRYGHELRAEVVRCENEKTCQVGHGAR